MQKLIGWFVLFLSGTVCASYEENCALTAKVLKDTTTVAEILADETEKYTLDLNIKVLSVKPSGRADSGCRAFIQKRYKNFSVTLTENVPSVFLNEGQTIKLNYHYFDDRGNPKGHTTYQLLDD